MIIVITIVLTAIRFWHQYFYILADQFFGAITKYFFNCGVDALEDPLLINRNNSIRNNTRQRKQAFLVFQSLLAGF